MARSRSSSARETTPESIRSSTPRPPGSCCSPPRPMLSADRSRAKALPAPLALSLVFPHPSCNEKVVQSMVAVQLGLPQVLATFDEAVGAGRLLAAALHLSSRLPSPLLSLFEPGYQH